MFDGLLKSIFEVVKLQWGKEIRAQGHSLNRKLGKEFRSQKYKNLKRFYY